MVEVGSADIDGLIHDALRRHNDGEAVLIMIESGNGSVGPIEDTLLTGIEVVDRVLCAAACQADSGALADVVGEQASGAIVIENAQWADPTSLGRLQRMLGSVETMPLVVLAHQPMSGVESWGIDQLAKAFGESGHVVTLNAGSGDESEPHADLDGSSFDLVAACSLLTRPVAVSDAARVLAMSEDDVLELGHDLASDGLLREMRGGFSATPAGVSAVVGQEARIGRVAGRLADTLADGGATEALVGSLRFDAGQHEQAAGLLMRAADEASGRHRSGEAFRLASMALESAEEAGSGESGDLGRMHLVCARFLRDAGRTRWAIEHADRAAATVGGPERVESLHLAAMLADDEQRPQDAEHLIAIAEWEAIRTAGGASLAPLLAFRSRALNRIGFAEEADDTIGKAEALAAQSQSEEDGFDVRTNKAWIHFDRGEMSRAEIDFTHLRDESERLGGRASEADKEAWRARSLFPSGHPTEALEAIAVAQEISRAEGIEAPLFLSDLAIAEGAVAYGRAGDALAASERALDLVTRQLPAWENMALVTRARVHIASREWDSAREDLEAASRRTPEGANGWRWRIRCRALAVEVDAAAGSWREEEAEDVADLLLQAKLYGWASEALCIIAENGGRESAAVDAMNLALSIGQPLLAARAAHAGDLWGDSLAAATILGVRAVDHRVPPEWREDWEALPHIAGALGAAVPEEDPDLEAVAENLNAALAGAGLTREAPILSPSQRRNRGLVAGQERTARRRRIWTIAAALGVVVLAAGTAFGVTQLGQEEPEAAPDDAVTATAPPTTVVLALEETQIPVPSEIDFFFGTSVHRGSYERQGIVEASGPREVNGYYWRFQTAGPIEASPIVFGTTVYVGTTEGTFFALDQTTGNELWTLPPEGRIGAAPALGEGEMAENRAPMMVVVVDDDGAVRGHDAAVPTGVQWTTRLDTRIRSSPVIVDGRVYLATDEGLVHALDLIEGTEIWRYPAEGDLGTISADLAFHDGTLYVATEEGALHLIDVTGDAPTLVCEFDAVDPIVTNPIITDEVTYVATMGQSIWPIPTGACEGNVPNRLPAYITDTPVRVGPAIVGDTIYMPGGRYLYSIDLTSGEHLWQPSKVTAEAPISTPPVVTTDAIYFASEDGVVHAVDLASGDVLWQWQTGLHVRATPAVVDGVVFVAAGDGYVYALGP